MEEFDQNIKSKIDALNKVPGVDFNEERVWGKVKSKIAIHPNRYLLLFVFLLIVFVGWMVTSLPNTHKKGRAVHEKSNCENEPKSSINYDSSKITKLEISNKRKIDETTYPQKLKAYHIDNSKKKVINVTPAHFPSYSVSTKKNEVLISKPIDQVSKNKKEGFFSAGRNVQTAGVAHVKNLTPRLSFVYGIQLNKIFNSEFTKSEGAYGNSKIDQLQIPFGLRYYFLPKEKRFNPYLYGGLTNSFLLRDNVRRATYHLNFESSIDLSFRVFSTKDGKRGFLRFRLPLYNSNLINQGFYKPSLYDVLKK